MRKKLNTEELTKFHNGSYFYPLANLKEMSQYFLTIDWKVNIEDERCIDTAYNNFIRIYKQGCEQYVPKRYPNFKSKVKKNSWANLEIKKLSRLKYKIWMKYKSTNKKKKKN